MSRIPSVDVLRSVAIIFVIAIHTTPFALQSYSSDGMLDLATVINQTARFAVPFFFVLSGYFWAKKFNDVHELFGPTARMAKRIAIIFIAWSAIYLLPTDIACSLAYGLTGPVKQVYWNLVSAANSPLTTLMQGTKVHLWFLMGLLCSLSISALLLRFKLNRLLVVVAVALYLVGLAGKAYRDTPIGFYADFNFRNGPFFSLIFFVTGYFLQRRQASARWFPLGCLLAVLGLLLHFTELLVLHRNWGTTIYQDYVAGTYFLGVGVALIALSNTKWLQSSRLSSIGPLVLGIYVSHCIFVDLLAAFDRRYSGNVIWDISYVVAVFLLSFAVALILSKHKLTKGLVT